MLMYLLMLACAYGLALMVYRYDMYNKEPWYLLLLTVVIGAGVGWLVGAIVQDQIVFLLLGESDQSIIGQAAIASVLEESVKLIIVLGIALAFAKHFDDPMDGLVYGAFAGLGFAIEESRFYIGLAATVSEQTGPEFIRLFLHLLLGGLDGFGLGIAKFRLARWKLVLPIWFAVSITIHFLWNFLIGLPEAGTHSDAFLRIAAVSVMSVATLFFALSVWYGARCSRAQFAPLSRKRLWGWPLTLLFSRRGSGESKKS